MTAPGRVLIIEPDSRRADLLASLLRRNRCEVTVVADARAGWRAFAQERPTHVLASLRCPLGEGGDWFLHRLNSEYLGAMPQVFVTCTEEELGELQASEPSCFLVWPIAVDTLTTVIFGGDTLGDTPVRQATRLRELYELSLLGSDLIQELDTLAARASLAFQASDCIIWGPRSEPYWPRMTRKVSASERERLVDRCQLAMNARTTVVFSQAASDDALVEGASVSLQAAALGPSGERPLAGICLHSDHPRLYSGEERDSLRVLARRLSSELAWMSAHNRLVIEHEKLRQTALLDPMLGVWTRPALEQAIHNQLSVAEQAPTPLALALLDYKQLRSVNDRFGHVVGDAVLAHFARVVSNGLRPQDQVGRFGGDELAVLMVGATLEQAERLTLDIIAQLKAAPYVAPGISIVVHVHAGVTSLGSEEVSAEGGFARALAAMTRARRAAKPIERIDPEREVVYSGDIDLGRSHNQLAPAGATLGGMYRILHEISRGAMGVVYRGEDLGLGRPVAIKVLRSDLASDQDLVAKFRAEAALLASLRHRNLVQVYSFGTEREDVFFVMELVEGEPLSQIVHRELNERRYLDVLAVAKVVDEIADALDAIHNLGIIHRDVKPENILVDRINDRAVLVDVGIARRPDDARDAAGTPGYAAPESFMEADETPATDVYGLAATTFAMLTGRAPFEGDELIQVVNRQLTETPPKPSEIRADLPVAVDSVLSTALAPEQGQRYRSASAFAIALNRALRRTASPPARSRRETIPTQVRHETLRDPQVSTYRLATPLAIPQTGEGLGYSRGALFRVAGVHLSSALGASWLDAVAGADESIAELLKPTLSPTSWHRVEHLAWLLRCTDGHIQDPHALCYRLGQAMMTATLAQFFGADPSSHSAASLLKAAESYWRRYHNWGQLQVTLGENQASVVLTGCPQEPLLCSLLAGCFQRIPCMGSASQAECRIAEMANGRASFVVQWF